MTNVAAKKKKTGPLKFLREVRQEGRKVTWTTRKETIISTVMVVIFTLLAALFFFLTDTIIRFVVGLFLAS